MGKKTAQGSGDKSAKKAKTETQDLFGKHGDPDETCKVLKENGFYDFFRVIDYKVFETIPDVVKGIYEGLADDDAELPSEEFYLGCKPSYKVYDREEPIPFKVICEALEKEYPDFEKMPQEDKRALQIIYFKYYNNKANRLNMFRAYPSVVLDATNRNIIECFRDSKGRVWGAFDKKKKMVVPDPVCADIITFKGGFSNLYPDYGIAEARKKLEESKGTASYEKLKNAIASQAEITEKDHPSHKFVFIAGARGSFTRLFAERYMCGSIQKIMLGVNKDEFDSKLKDACKTIFWEKKDVCNSAYVFPRIVTDDATPGFAYKGNLSFNLFRKSDGGTRTAMIKELQKKGDAELDLAQELQSCETEALNLDLGYTLGSDIKMFAIKTAGDEAPSPLSKDDWTSMKKMVFAGRVCAKPRYCNDESASSRGLAFDKATPALIEKLKKGAEVNSLKLLERQGGIGGGPRFYGAGITILKTARGVVGYSDSSYSNQGYEMNADDDDAMEEDEDFAAFMAQRKKEKQEKEEENKLGDDTLDQSEVDLLDKIEFEYEQEGSPVAT